MPQKLSASKEMQIKKDVARGMIQKAAKQALDAKLTMMQAEQKLREAQRDYDHAREDWQEAERQVSIVRASCCAK